MSFRIGARTAAHGAATLVLLLLCTGPAHAVPYIMAGPAASLSSASGSWGWSGSNLAAFRSALEDPANFGASGIADYDIDTIELSAINATTLSGVDGFVTGWWSDSQSRPHVSALTDFFMAGGDLILTQDDASHDRIGQSLGIRTQPYRGDGNSNSGGAPLFDGLFGSAASVTQHYNTGRLSAAAISARGGTVGSTDQFGNVTSAFWAAGAYAPGAGALVILGDTDMIATTGGNGAHYTPTLDDNARFALNTAVYVTAYKAAAVPEPEPWALMTSGILGLAWVGRNREPRT